MSEIATAPFTRDEVRSLNAYQASGVFHDFTCGNDDCPGRASHVPALVAVPAGWACAYCDYTQDWAHAWMADWSWLRK